MPHNPPGRSRPRGIFYFEFAIHPPSGRDACTTESKPIRLVLVCGRSGRTCRRDACATKTNQSGMFCSAAVPAAQAGGTPALQGRPCSPCGSLPAPSTNRNQPPRPSITPTSRKVAAGPARRGFPRAGGRGVGAGKKRMRASAHPNVARRRAAGAQRWRSMTPTRACSRRRRRPRTRGRGRRPRTAGGHGSGTEVRRSVLCLWEDRGMAIATFGAGCFWGVEAAFRQIEGVTDAAAGYAGGTTEKPTYPRRGSAGRVRRGSGLV